jgi:hypothetical protein
MLATLAFAALVGTDAVSVQVGVNENERGEPDFSEIKGQRALRRAIEVACSGNHNLLMLCLFTQNSNLAMRRNPNSAESWSSRQVVLATEWKGANDNC